LRNASAEQLQQQQTAYRALQLEMTPVARVAAKGSLSRTKPMISIRRASLLRTPRFPPRSMTRRFEKRRPIANLGTLDAAIAGLAESA